MRTTMRMVILIGASLTASACAVHAPPAPVAATRVALPPPLPPFDDTPQSFMVHASRFSAGESTVVRVCIDDAHSVTSADVVESSGDHRFDEVAVQWARQVKIRTPGAGEAPMSRCGTVKVEIRPTRPGVLDHADEVLG